jgi:hypothetical protein
MQSTVVTKQSLWQKFHRPIKKKIDPNLQRDLKHGWLFAYLVGIDGLFWGRWQYWARCQSMPSHALSRWQMEPMLAVVSGRESEPLPKFVIEETLPDEPIPQISWQYHDDALKMLNYSLDCIPEYGEWLTMSSSTYLRYFIDWVLFGFGHPAIPELPAEPMGCKGASMRLYQTLDLSYLLYYPEDYLGRIVALSYGKRSQQAIALRKIVRTNI